MPEDISFLCSPTQQLLNKFTQNHLQCLDGDWLSFNGDHGLVPGKQTQRWSFACRMLILVFAFGTNTWWMAEKEAGVVRAVGCYGEQTTQALELRWLFRSPHIQPTGSGLHSSASSYCFTLCVLFCFQLEKLKRKVEVRCPKLEEGGPNLKPRPTNLHHVMCWEGSWGEWIKGICVAQDHTVPSSFVYLLIYSINMSYA